MTRLQNTTWTALVALIVLLSSCGFGSGTEAEESGWWTERTWAGEIGVCIDALDDPTGCQLLAGLLIHRRCSLKIYQTIAAGLFVGGDFETMYSEAETAGDCEGLEEIPTELPGAVDPGAVDPGAVDPGAAAGT